MPSTNPSIDPAGRDNAARSASAGTPAVIIIGPPWPRSGTARVIQNQIQYYQQRGFFTIFIVVPFHWAYLEGSKIWDDLKDGIGEFGADRIEIASLTSKKFTQAKYKASLRYALRGTALDWTVTLGAAAELPAGTIGSFQHLPARLLHVNHVYTLGYALRLRQSLRADMPIILETHDVQSHLIREKGDANPWTRRPDRVEKLVRSETAWLKHADALVHLSVDDFRFFQEQLPSKPHVLAMPTIDETFVSVVQAAPLPAEPIDLLFVGQWHKPNLAAITWFLEKVWPLIASRGYNLKIAGLVGEFMRQQEPRVYEAFHSCFVGEVADLAPYYRAARCVIAPMISGSGTSIKTIEALAMGKPFVGASKAFRGMPMETIRQAGVTAYDDPASFADAIVRTLASEAEAGARSRAAYDRVFSMSAAFAARDEAFREALGEPAQQPEMQRASSGKVSISY